MEDKDFLVASEHAKEDVIKKINEFQAKLEAGKDGTILTISEIEREWRELRLSTDKIYSDMVASYLSKVDEKELIKSKKENSEGKGLSSKTTKD